jgi:hypothetical protein
VHHVGFTTHILIENSVSKTENTFLAYFFCKAEGRLNEVGFVHVKMLPYPVATLVFGAAESFVILFVVYMNHSCEQ